MLKLLQEAEWVTFWYFDYCSCNWFGFHEALMHHAAVLPPNFLRWRSLNHLLWVSLTISFTSLVPFGKSSKTKSFTGNGAQMSPLSATESQYHF
jgi:hypothetical protein